MPLCELFEIDFSEECDLSRFAANATDILLARTRRQCRECGCTEFAPCIDGCCWVEEDLCSSCAYIEDLPDWFWMEAG